jgi:uncharacterized protein
VSNHIIVRNRQFKTTPAGARHSTDENPIALAFYASLSATFPLGEAFFVRSVAQYAKQIPADLKIEVEAFVRQEALHSREHSHFNNSIGEAGLPMEAVTARAGAQLAILETRADINRLASTVALEHFTSVFAQELLADPRHLAYCDPVSRALWQWHAVEEIEHKAVAMDVFNHVTADWSSLKRWLCRCGAMADAIVRLSFVAWFGMAGMLDQEGYKTAGWRARVLHYLFVGPGLLTAMSGQIARFFLPGFHPNQTDEGQLLTQARAALEPVVG